MPSSRRRAVRSGATGTGLEKRMTRSLLTWRRVGINVVCSPSCRPQEVHERSDEAHELSPGWLRIRWSTRVPEVSGETTVAGGGSIPSSVGLLAEFRGPGPWLTTYVTRAFWKPLRPLDPFHGHREANYYRSGLKAAYKPLQPSKADSVLFEPSFLRRGGKPTGAGVHWQLRVES